MKKRIVTLLLTLCCVFGICFGNVTALSAKAETAEQPTKIDYASQVEMHEDSQKLELTVKMFIDGDTTHFNAPTFPNGVFKARYSAVDTPESTGKLEEWGKKASRFTREKLETATSIIVESETNEWKPDSTGDRYVCWVWYKAPGETTYRNLNVELLQEGLARASNTGTSRYGEIAMAAFTQSNALKLNLWSGEKDPDFYYGESVELDLKELRLNIANYSNIRVAFEGIVAYYLNQGVYVESFDEETQMYFGVYVYYGFTSISAQATNILAIGNKVRITGVVQYYEGGGTYQVADLKYNKFMPSDDDIRLIEKNAGAAAHQATTATQFVSAKMIPVMTTDPDTGDQVPKEKPFRFAQLALHSSISMKNLKVVDVYTTSNGGDNDGAMTLTCTSEDVTITVRTVVLRDYLGNKITAEQLQGKTIDVKGIVDFYDGDYQIKVMSLGGLVRQGEPWPTPPAEDSSSSAPAEDTGCDGIVVVYVVLPILVVAAVLVAVVIKKRNNKDNTCKNADETSENTENQ